MSSAFSGKRKNSAVGSSDDLSTPPPSTSTSSTVEDLLVQDDFDLDLDLEEADDLVTELMRPSNPVNGASAVNGANAHNAVRERTSSVSDTDLVDYDSVSSPGGSSTASGPTYIRQAGFDQHAHEVQAAPTSVGGERANNHSESADRDSGDGHAVTEHRRQSVSSSNSSKASASVLSRHSFSSAAVAGHHKVGGLGAGLGVTARKKKKNGLLLSTDLSLGGKKKIEGVVASSGGGIPTSTRSKSRKGKNKCFLWSVTCSSLFRHKETICLAIARYCNHNRFSSTSLLEA